MILAMPPNIWNVKCLNKHPHTMFKHFYYSIENWSMKISLICCWCPSLNGLVEKMWPQIVFNLVKSDISFPAQAVNYEWSLNHIQR